MCPTCCHVQRRPRGFTLVELLVVIAIIGMRIDGKTTDLVIQLQPDKALARSGSQK
jgi:prepilin-type N-terminal cleavage/methylation domain-containing protein